MENAFFEIKKDLVFKSLISEALYNLAYSKHLLGNTYKFPKEKKH